LHWHLKSGRVQKLPSVFTDFTDSKNYIFHFFMF